jgi:NADH-quinone oxidoreductase subunit B/C/D
MAVIEEPRSYFHPLYDVMLSTPGLSVGVAPLDRLLTWGLKNALWVFPMATSCCGIELMASAAARVDLDRMGTIMRASPRQSDVMVVAGTITVKMAPRVRRLWDQMPEPKWCIAMGSCAISGDFYRNLYPVVPGIDTFLPVDVYVPGCPPNPEALMHGLLRLQEKIGLQREGKLVPAEPRPDFDSMVRPALSRIGDSARAADLSDRQEQAALKMCPDAEPGVVDDEQNGFAQPATQAIPPLNTELVELLRDRFGVTEIPANAPPVVAAEKHLELAATLQKMGYRQFLFVAATHRPAKEGSEDLCEVAYGLRTVGPGTKEALWQIRVPAAQSVASLVPLFAGADWQEREQYDLVGVKFAGHPDLRRIMLSDDWVGHPLRRDYPADKECAPWR